MADMQQTEASKAQEAAWYTLPKTRAAIGAALSEVVSAARSFSDDGRMASTVKDLGRYYEQLKNDTLGLGGKKGPAILPNTVEVFSVMLKAQEYDWQESGKIKPHAEAIAHRLQKECGDHYSEELRRHSMTELFSQGILNGHKVDDMAKNSRGDIDALCKELRDRNGWKGSAVDAHPDEPSALNIASTKKKESALKR